MYLQYYRPKAQSNWDLKHNMDNRDSSLMGQGAHSTVMKTKTDNIRVSIMRYIPTWWWKAPSGNRERAVFNCD